MRARRAGHVPAESGTRRSRPSRWAPASDGGEELTFVVQRHDARRLHYDFRLERDGVLASWAVPKGVPLEPGRQHLAVHVEDHPLEYGSFEGEIPKGEYGAGTVEIWDRGTYELLEEKKNGGLTVRLHGERLEGIWTLDPGQALRRPEELADPPQARGRRRWPSTREYRPMLATTSKDVPRGDGWLFEIKWDGYRIVSRVRRRGGRAASRRWEDYTQRFPGVARALPSALKSPDFVVDGEVCALDDQGRPSFSAMQQGKPETPIVYFVFDLLEVDGEPLIDLPLSERRARLEELLDRGNRTVRALGDVRRRRGARRGRARSGSSRGSWPSAPSRATCRARGARSGSRSSRHGSARSSSSPATRKGQGRRANSFGSLVLAVREGGELRYVGNVGTGFGEDEIGRLLDEAPPARAAGRAVPRRCRRCRASARRTSLGRAEARRRGRVRRVDARRAPARAGVPGAARGQGRRGGASPSSRSRSVIEDGKRMLKLSNLDKVFFPEDGITKGDLLSYYRAVAPVARSRTCATGRSRSSAIRTGSTGSSSSRRTRRRACPSGSRRVPVEVDHAGEAAAHAHDPGAARQRRAGAALDGEHGLHRPEHVVLAGRQAGPARLRALRPRPVAGRGLPEDVQVALLVRDALDALGLEGFPKTSGSDGMHVLVPVERRHTYAETREFAEIVARALARTHRGLVTTEWTKEKRRGVLIDSNQNGEGKTIASVYSVRPRAGGPVSTPLELGRGERARSIPRRSRWTSCSAASSGFGDLFEPVLTTRQRLDRRPQGASASACLTFERTSGPTGLEAEPPVALLRPVVVVGDEEDEVGAGLACGGTRHDRLACHGRGSQFGLVETSSICASVGRGRGPCSDRPRPRASRSRAR